MEQAKQLSTIEPPKKFGEILISYNYEAFSHIDGNRSINRTNYAKLEKSMLEEQLIVPICVNRKMQIIDGQHRFEVSKNNCLPVYYYVVEDYAIEQVKRANMVNRVWGKKDFLHLQIESGKDDYVVFGYLIDTYHVTVQDALKVFALLQKSNLGLIGKAFEEGNFSDEGCEKVEDFLKALQDFNTFKYYNSSQFTTAFMRLYFHKRYDHNRMIERLKKHEGALVKKGTIDEYLVTLTRDIYSFGATRNGVYYDQINKRFY